MDFWRSIDPDSFTRTQWKVFVRSHLIAVYAGIGVTLTGRTGRLADAARNIGTRDILNTERDGAELMFHCGVPNLPTMLAGVLALSTSEIGGIQLRCTAIRLYAVDCSVFQQ